MSYSFWLAARVLLYASTHRQDFTHHGLCYTSRGALAGMRNSLMGPPWRIDPTTNRTMGERSNHGATSRSLYSREDTDYHQFVYHHRHWKAHLNYLGCFGQWISNLFVSHYSETKEGIMALHLPLGILKTCSRLQLVPRCEPSTFQATGQWQHVYKGLHYISGAEITVTRNVSSLITHNSVYWWASNPSSTTHRVNALSVLEQEVMQLHYKKEKRTHFNYGYMVLDIL